MLPAPLEERGSTSRLGAGGRRRALGVFAAVCAVGVAGCGGGERQDEDEPEGDFPVEVVAAEFPPKQRLAQTSELTLTIANAGEETIPDLALTVFTEANDDAAGDDAVTDEGDADTGSASATDAEGEEQLGEQVDEALQEELEQDGTSAEGGEGSDGSEDAGGSGAPESGSGAEGSFYVRSEQEGLAVPSRPVWILEQGYPRLAGAAEGRPPPGEIAAA